MCYFSYVINIRDECWKNTPLTQAKSIYQLRVLYLVYKVYNLHLRVVLLIETFDRNL